jgi:hypothetical protein
MKKKTNNGNRDFLIPNLALKPTQTFPITLTSPSITYHKLSRHNKAPVPPNYSPLYKVIGPLLPPGEIPAKADVIFVLYTTMAVSELDLKKPTGQINRTS